MKYKYRIFGMADVFLAANPRKPQPHNFGLTQREVEAIRLKRAAKAARRQASNERSRALNPASK